MAWADGWKGKASTAAMTFVDSIDLKSQNLNWHVSTHGTTKLAQRHEPRAGNRWVRRRIHSHRLDGKGRSI